MRGSRLVGHGIAFLSEVTGTSPVMTVESVARSWIPPTRDGSAQSCYHHRMRLKSGIWVAAYVRRCNVEGLFAAVRRRGAEEAGAIFIKINRLDGTGDLYGPAPQTAFDDSPTDRMFAACLKEPAQPETDIEARLQREIRFDPDLWIVEVEDRQGRHWLDDQLAR